MGIIKTKTKIICIFFSLIEFQIKFKKGVNRKRPIYILTYHEYFEKPVIPKTMLLKLKSSVPKVIESVYKINIHIIYFKISGSNFL